jgi:type VI protein secretion system component VasF
MRLVTLADPVFQYVCRLHRSAAKGCTFPIEKARADVLQLFEEMRQQAASRPDLAAQYERIKLPLIFFVDFMMRESGLSSRTEWVPLARDYRELAGDEKFFLLLESDLKDPSDGATERLAVFYTCLWLGFTGLYFDQPEEIQRLMGRVSGRVSQFLGAEGQKRICPQAYEHTDTRNFTEPPGTKLVGIGIALIGLLVVWLITYGVLFQSTSSRIHGYLETINQDAGRTSSSVSDRPADAAAARRGG